MNARHFLEVYGQCAAVVCVHVAREGALAQYAARDEPAFPEDSGWQVHCAPGSHSSAEEGVLWAVKEIVSHEPSLRAIINAPAGSRFYRAGPNEPWQGVSRPSNASPS